MHTEPRHPTSFDLRSCSSIWLSASGALGAVRALVGAFAGEGVLAVPFSSGRF